MRRVNHKYINSKGWIITLLGLAVVGGYSETHTKSIAASAIDNASQSVKIADKDNLKEKDKIPAIVNDVDASVESLPNPFQFDSHINTTIQMEATNASGTMCSNTDNLGSLVDADATSINAVYTFTNTSDKAQQPATSLILTLSSYYDKPEFTTKVAVSDQLAMTDITKNLPKDVKVVGTTDSGLFNNKDLSTLQAEPGFRWSKLKKLEVSYTGPIAAKSSFSISIPLKIQKLDALTSHGKFQIGFVRGDFSGALSVPVRLARVYPKLDGRKYIATTISNDGQYELSPTNIQKLMPKVKQADIKNKSNPFFHMNSKASYPNLYSGSSYQIDLESTKIPDIVKNFGYSVQLNKDGTPWPIYSYQFDNDEPNNTFIYPYVAIRKVIDTKDLNLKVGNKWTKNDNLISVIGNDNKPLASKDVTIKVSDPDGIVKNGTIIKDGQLSVTYSYKISDKYYDKKEPYIISKTAYVNVKSDVENPAVKPVKPEEPSGRKPETTQTVESTKPNESKPEPTKPVTPNLSTNHVMSEKPNGSSQNCNCKNEFDDNKITHIQQLLETFPYSGDVSLYKLNGNEIENRNLSDGTGWFSDQQMIQGNRTKFRVAPDEWVESKNVYIYNNQKSIIQTKRNSIQKLTDAKGEQITDCALAGDTAWKTDRIAYINGMTYYRVATNEFVPTHAVTIIR